MDGKRLAGGPTTDEVMAVSLAKLELHSTDTFLEIGCGTGKVTCAAALLAGTVISIDRRPEAVAAAQEAADRAGIQNIRFSCAEAAAFLDVDDVYDCAFVGGSQQLAEVLPVLVKKVRGRIVINAVMLSTVSRAVAILEDLGVFIEAVHVQVSRSHPLAGSIMFRPSDPVYIIVGRGCAC
jgi:cobalt-precorrin-6B (C15)-methyltransferase